MKKISLLLFAFIFVTTGMKAQFAVYDHANFIQKIYFDYAEFLTIASNTLGTVKETGKIFDQGEKYYNALKDVHYIVKKSRNVEGCVKLSSETLIGFQNTYSKMLNDSYYSPDQISVYRKQQENILSAIAKNIEGLNNIIVNTGMSISDKDRLDAIDTYHARILTLHNESRGLNFQILGESESVAKRKQQKRLERELLR